MVVQALFGLHLLHLADSYWTIRQLVKPKYETFVKGSPSRRQQVVGSLAGEHNEGCKLYTISMRKFHATLRMLAWWRNCMHPVAIAIPIVGLIKGELILGRREMRFETCSLRAWKEPLFSFSTGSIAFREILRAYSVVS